MLILDTNILSELMKPQGSTIVKAWVKKQLRNQLFITSITKAEILYGIAILPNGKRQQLLQEKAQAMFKQDFLNHILPFDEKASDYFALISRIRKEKGKPISQFDAQIAGICRSHQAILITRNVDDFLHCGVEIINPWDSEIDIEHIW